jgi:hypothetical protein
MRSAMIALATAATLMVGSFGASAGPSVPSQVFGSGGNGEDINIQKADWYCGPRCHYWHHRHWQERHSQGYGYHPPYHYYYRYGYRY